MDLSSSAFPVTFTRSTIALTILSPVGIDGVVDVSIITNCFDSVSCRRASSSKHIDFLRDWFEMIWANAFRVSAKMVNRQPFGDLTDKQFIADPMSKARLKRAVASRTFRPLPDPAAFASSYIAEEAHHNNIHWRTIPEVA